MGRRRRRRDRAWVARPRRNGSRRSRLIGVIAAASVSGNPPSAARFTQRSVVPTMSAASSIPSSLGGAPFAAPCRWPASSRPAAQLRIRGHGVQRAWLSSRILALTGRVSAAGAAACPSTGRSCCAEARRRRSSRRPEQRSSGPNLRPRQAPDRVARSRRRCESATRLPRRRRYSTPSGRSRFELGLRVAFVSLALARRTYADVPPVLEEQVDRVTRRHAPHPCAFVAKMTSEESSVVARTLVFDRLERITLCFRRQK